MAGYLFVQYLINNGNPDLPPKHPTHASREVVRPMEYTVQ